ncbi:MAG: hypothetical protein Q7V15_02190 [Phenylobacterium sp.]|uniref:hypothetical protein n=1 Tax=Phenylobacterium sp. TaxID=1871053 RepID=UPI00271608DD|nr:hypothetical protein [Phenylobacterium sp.]MDO8900144.1 hypothetical protein [Phenylobacterium sp.]
MMSIRALVTAVAAGALAASALSLYVAGRRDGGQHRQAEIAVLTRERDIARLEADGERASGQRLAAALSRGASGRAVVSTFIPQALNTEDGHEILAADRAARLHDADRRLCQAAPDLTGCAAAGPGG